MRDTMKTRSKRKLMWRVAFMTFFLSAILDNLTTSIVMIMVPEGHSLIWAISSSVVAFCGLHHGRSFTL